MHYKDFIFKVIVIPPSSKQIGPIGPHNEILEICVHQTQLNIHILITVLYHILLKKCIVIYFYQGVGSCILNYF